MKRPLFLLVYPEVPATYWSYKHALPFIGRRAVMPPLGLATIAAMVPDDYECQIVDMNVERLTDRRLAQADLVLVSAMIVQAGSMQRLISRCRNAGVPVAAGGPYATSCHSRIEGVDYFILGEAELTFPRFLADYAAGRPQPMYECDGRPDLETVPIPRLDLLKLKYYDTFPLQFSRGCPFDCEFCDIVHLFGHRPRVKGTEQFIAELDAVYASGFRGAVFIVDDNFIGNRRAVKDLLRALAVWQEKHRKPFHFSTEASIDLASDPELLDLMQAAKFSMVFVGIETPDAASLSQAGKHQNVRRDVVESVRMIQERGIEVTGGFIVGFDSDPPGIFDLQIQHIEELAIPTAMVGLLMALPNTRLYERLKTEGRLLSESSGNNTHDTVLNFRTAMDEETLRAGYLRVLETIYRPDRYFRRCLDVLERYPRQAGAARHERPIRLRELVGLGSSLVRQLFSSYRLDYVRYLWRAVRSRPDLIVSIITFSIVGHHYFTITRAILRRNRATVRSERRRTERLANARSRDTIESVVDGREAIG